MRLLTGTSGYSYKEWKGPFYPEDLPAAAMLSFYAERLPTVEINNTFYRMPTAELVAKWAEQVPPGFVFVIKAPQRITHRARLAGAEESIETLWSVAGELGPRLGPILFQLPPWFRRDTPRLRDFLAGLPAGMRAALEFRHESWAEEEVLEVLRAANAALCTADIEGGPFAEPVATADFGYLRLRRPDYGDAELSAWVERVRAQGWKEAFVFFKHEDEGLAPRLAHRFAALFGEVRS